MHRRPTDRAAFVLATWFGCGYVPFAPGTAGTLAAVPLYLLVRPYGMAAVASVALVIAVVGIWAGSVVAVQTDLKDPQIVVIDEVAGVLVTLTAAPLSFRGIVAAVVLFRIFDEWKPWLARIAERRLPGGWGIVLDDIVSGVWGALLLLLLRAAGVL